MSTAVFPALAGISYPIRKTPEFSTGLQTATSGKELRTAYWSYPKWHLELPYEFLNDYTGSYNDVRKLLGFFLSRQGQYDPFNYSDPDDNAVTAQNFGTGDGTTTKFQLLRTFGAGGFTFTEPVFRTNGAPSLFDNGSPVSGGSYSIDGEGMVTFNSAPTNGHALTWTGSFYYRVRFETDTVDVNQFFRYVWEAKKIPLVSVK